MEGESEAHAVLMQLFMGLLFRRTLACGLGDAAPPARCYSDASVGRLGGALIGRGNGPVPASPMAAWVRIAPAIAFASFCR